MGRPSRRNRRTGILPASCSCPAAETAAPEKPLQSTSLAKWGKGPGQVTTPHGFCSTRPELAWKATVNERGAQHGQENLSAVF